MLMSNDNINKILEKYINDAKKLTESIYLNPEKGYYEYNTTKLFSDYLEKLGLKVKRNIVRTGCISTIDFNNAGPKIAVLAELDAIKCSEHPDANLEGYVHACGHNLQVGSAFLIAALLKEMKDSNLCGSVDIIGVPSEEYIEINAKEKLAMNGSITYFGGKQELIKYDLFKDTDIAILTHVMPKSSMLGKDILIGGAGIGFVAKKIDFIGKESHAGTSSHKGINALNAMMLSLNNINALRETFEEGKGIRVHSIMNEGGETVNMIPSRASLEMHVRSRFLDDLIEVNKKINNCFNAGALAIGCNVVIKELPGYLPSINYENINQLCREVTETVISKDKVGFGSVSGSANDFGDVSQLMTTLKIYSSGVEGSLHSRDFKLIDFDKACILPALVIYKTIQALLENNGQKAKEIINNNEILLTKDKYIETLNSFSKTIEYNYMD